MHRSLLCLVLFAALALGCSQKDETANSGNNTPAPAKAPTPKPPGKKPAKPEPTPDPEPEPQPEPAPKTKPKGALPGDAIEITAEALAKAYQADEAAADAKYKRKALLVTGAIFAKFQF